MQLRRVAEAKLPTRWGEFTIVGFEEIATGKNHVALVMGDIQQIPDNKDDTLKNGSSKSESSAASGPILTRIHSECLTGDALFSLRCDCGFQLEAALKQIAKAGRGILLYHRQEGRNIGLLNKIRAYALQDQGMDTVEANHQLGFAADERDFTLCADMLELLGVKQIRLLTNNPEKIRVLEDSGIEITERVPLEVGENPNNEHYLETKASKMGHLLHLHHHPLSPNDSDR
ncbi:GTP cyclohydrolase II [Orbaceae bacterium ESL0727]|nr:GTP cyclohydrolase II [Orbaceae bacterium ESL0727]